MGRNGRLGDAQRNEGTGGGRAQGAPLEAGSLTVDELMRVRALEEPRSFVARLFGVSPIGAESEQLFARALGERAVGELLVQLGDGWKVLHSIPVGREGARLDHLVIGPPGVFVVTTRNHPGADVVVSGRNVLVSETKVAHIRVAELALGSAERGLSQALGGPLVVTGLLVFVDPASLSLRTVSKDLQVLASADMLPWLEAQPDVFDEEEVTRIAGAAGIASTWNAPPQPRRVDGSDELEGLLRVVDRAQTLRQLWFGGITILIVVAATALATAAIVGVIPGAVAH